MPESVPPAGNRSRSPHPPPARPAAPKRKPLIQVAADDRGELSPLEIAVRELRRNWVGILLSIGLYALTLVLLGVIPIWLDSPPPIGVIRMEWATDAPKKATPTAPVQLSTPIQLTRPVPVAVTPAPTPQPVENPAPETAAVAPVAVTASLGGRTQKAGDNTTRDGFNDDARQTLDKALRWLAKQQQADGHWSLDGPYADGATRTRFSTHVGATGLALLAFLGDGHTHQSGQYTAAVEKGLTWLLTQQRTNGEIYDGSEEGEEPSIYSHAIGTIVLCESLALTGDPRFRAPAERAIEYLIAAQNPVQGGWRYRPLSESGEGDLSVTGWALMALHTARMAELNVNPEAFLLASSFLDRCQENPRDPAHYKYTPTYPPDRGQRASMTASGLLARQWLGWPRKHGPLKAGVSFLLSDEARPDWEGGHRNVYAWYYQAQVLHNLGGEPWQAWFAELQQLLVRRQQATGKEAGSWHPTQPPGSNHEWSAVVGRLYVTVMCVLILETPTRHAPLYEEPKS